MAFLFSPINLIDNIKEEYLGKTQLHFFKYRPKKSHAMRSFIFLM